MSVVPASGRATGLPTRLVAAVRTLDPAGVAAAIAAGADPLARSAPDPSRPGHIQTVMWAMPWRMILGDALETPGRLEDAVAITDVLGGHGVFRDPELAHDALGSAVFHAIHPVVPRLIAHGADPLAWMTEDDPPLPILHMACMVPSHDMAMASTIEHLLAAGAEADREIDGMTPLARAIRSGGAETALTLLHAGADPCGPGVGPPQAGAAWKLGGHPVGKLFLALHGRDLHPSIDGVPDIPLRAAAVAAARTGHPSAMRLLAAVGART